MLMARKKGLIQKLPRLSFAFYGMALLSFSACDSDRYQLTKDNNGHMVRLDKRTGEMAWVDGEELIRVKSLEESENETRKLEAEKQALDKIIKSKKWKDIRSALKDPDFHDLPLLAKRDYLKQSPDTYGFNQQDIDDVLGKAWNKYSVSQEKRFRKIEVRKSFLGIPLQYYKPLPTTTRELIIDRDFHKQSIEIKRAQWSKLDSDFAGLAQGDQDELLGEAWNKYYLQTTDR
jgi:hypothetical protein